jgi:hypothetical protein
VRRRDFIKVIAGCAAQWPLMAGAQRVMPLIGFLSSASRDGYRPMATAFRQGLEEYGCYVEGRDVAIEYRWANGRIDQLEAIAAELVRSQVSVIAAQGSSPDLRSREEISHGEADSDARKHVKNPSSLGGTGEPSIGARVRPPRRAGSAAHSAPTATLPRRAPQS